MATPEAGRLTRAAHMQGEPVEVLARVSNGAGDPDSGGGEVIEKSRGEGLQRAIGDLVTCPWCSAPWVAATLGFGFVFAPRVTRFVSGVFAAVTVSDFLQHAYDAAKERK